MLPFAETVLAWRLERGLTQLELARAARMPRSNLSAVERGEREVTLRTLRALALALGVRPGVLADGEPPASPGGALTRAALERVARAVVHDERLADPRESRLAGELRQSMSARLASGGAGKHRRRPHRRLADRAYLRLKGGVEREVLRSLIERVLGQIDRG